MRKFKMKKILLSMIACAVLASCGDDKGSAFIGVWKSSEKPTKTMTISKVEDGYRVQSKFDDPEWSSMNVEVKAKAEGDKSLVTSDGQKKIMELSQSGEIKSFLYGSPKTFTKSE